MSLRMSDDRLCQDCDDSNTAACADLRNRDVEHTSPTSPTCGARWLSGRMPDSQSRQPGFESPLIPFRSLGIFFHFTTPQSTQLYK